MTSIIKLLDAASRWLQPGVRSAEEVVGQVALEQLIAGLPSSTANWRSPDHRPSQRADPSQPRGGDFLEQLPFLHHHHTAPTPQPRHFPRKPYLTLLFLSLPRVRPTLLVVRHHGGLLRRQGWIAGGAGSPATSDWSVLSWRSDSWSGLQDRQLPPPIWKGRTVYRDPASSNERRVAEVFCSNKTDASNSGVGAVLSQQVEGVDRPVLYISRKLAQREVNYSTVEKECLAIRWAVGALRYYLLGRPFTLWSDHAPLQWLHRIKDANAWITRWYLALQPFNFKVIHRPGNRMVVADFLSRSAEGGESACGRRDPGLSRAVGVCGSGVWLGRRLLV
ncbi:uncharacterized protein LOC117471045 [Trematomus bernacchii]|uniref:uncharacterized protein LOC117471045 n=1 Tax=Trematomus bernacchii TaxID=40690 RepID=UPI00146B31D9|nr:uncharacterized protein LOC117471045 [Trematomus bernacchii]